MPLCRCHVALRKSSTLLDKPVTAKRGVPKLSNTVLQGSTDEERVALAAVRACEDVVCCRRLVPGSEPTPDWRVKMRDERVADIEVTRVTDGPARSVRSQLTREDNRSPREWLAPGLTHDWFVRVTVMSPAVGGRPATQLVEALVTVLRKAEDVGDTPDEMANIARERLPYPEQFLNQVRWAPSYRRAAREEGVTLEDWAAKWLFGNEWGLEDLLGGIGVHQE